LGKGDLPHPGTLRKVTGPLDPEVHLRPFPKRTAVHSSKGPRNKSDFLKRKGGGRWD
jgi:hypothetical protein